MSSPYFPEIRINFSLGEQNGFAIIDGAGAAQIYHIQTDPFGNKYAFHIGKSNAFYTDALEAAFRVAWWKLLEEGR